MTEWTIASLAAHMERVLSHCAELADERDRRYTQRFEAQDKAAAHAATALDVRLGSMNEFRSAMADQISTFATRDSLTSLAEKREQLTRNLEERMLLHFEQQDRVLSDLKEWVALKTGEAKGRATLVAALATVLAMISTVLSIVHLAGG